MTSITPRVPTRQRDPWHEYAAGRLTPQEIRELAAQAPPSAPGARHRKPNRRRVWHRAAEAAAIIALLAGTGITGAAIQAIAPQPAAAVTATLTAQHSQTPAQKTCAAFRTWEHAKTPRNLARLVTASTTLPKSWLKADTGQLYADASSPSAKAARYLGDDATHVNQDCGG